MHNSTSDHPRLPGSDPLNPQEVSGNLFKRLATTAQMNEISTGKLATRFAGMRINESEESTYETLK